MKTIRPRGFGCLALFSVLCLTAFTAAEGYVLYRMNPDWFDRLAWWRGPVLSSDVVLVPDPAAEEALAREDGESSAFSRQRLDTDTARVFEDRAVEVEYQPAQAATLKTLEEGVFEFPAGSVREAARLRAVPIESIPETYFDEHLALAGPSYKLFIGAHEHYQFAQPIRATLRYVPEMLPKDGTTKGLALYTWEDGQWKALPSTVDTRRHTVAADIAHCSWVVVALGATIGWVFSPHGQVTINSTGQGVISYGWHFADREYKTKHFNIHYAASGSAAPPQDGGPHPFPKELQPKNPDARHLNAVVLIGEYLEFCHDHLKDVGMAIPDGWVFNHNVYLVPQASLGETPPGGGPVYLTSDWTEGNGQLPPADTLDARIRGTVAHELIHVAQARYFGGASLRGDWWVEMTAAYLADLFWEKQGRPTNLVQNYYLNNDDGKMPTRPIDVVRISNEAYRNARFLKWLERTGQEHVLRVLEQVNSGGDPSVEAFDKALRQEFQKSLGELREAFAQDYYHFDLQARTILPASVYGGSNRTRAEIQSAVLRDTKDFTYVGRVPAASASSAGAAVGRLNLWQRTDVAALPPGTVQAFPIHVDVLPPDRKGKLVVLYEPTGAPDGDLSLTVARAQVRDATVPAPMEAFVMVVVKSPRTGYVVRDLSAPGGNNRVTILLSNRGTTHEIAGGNLERWALLAPAWAEAERETLPGTQHAQHWTATWHRSELKDFPKVFKGYNVYRRKWGEPDSAYKLVKAEHPDEVWTDHAPDEEDYAYMVRVVDVLGNESADSPLDRADPFQGQWEGEVQLVEGALVSPLVKFADKAGEEMERKEKEAIAALKDPAEKARRQKEWDDTKKAGKEVYDPLVKLLRTFEELARLGLPLQVQIRHANGKYYLGVPEVLYQKTGMGPKDEVEFKRVDRHTLQLADTPKELPPLFLRLHREKPDGRNEIRGGYQLDIPSEGKTERCRIRWTLERQPPG